MEQKASGHHGSRGTRLPQLQYALPRGPRRTRSWRSPRPRSPTSRAGSYPPELAGELYPDGIPILAEDELEGLIREQSVDEVWFSYSDVPHEYVMHQASRVIAGGAHFGVCSATRTMLESSRAGDRRLRGAHRRRQEPDHALRLDASSRSSARRSWRCATRCPTATSRSRSASASPRYDDLDRHETHDRGARGVRAAHRQRHRGLRRRRLRAHPAPRREGGRRHPVGRRQQRHAVLQARPAASCSSTRTGRARAELLPGRDQPAPGRRRARQQGADGRARERRSGSSDNCRAAQSAGARSSSAAR